MRALEAETAAAKEAEVVDSRAIAMLEARVAAGDVNEASLELRELRRQRQRRRGMLAAAFSADVQVARLSEHRQWSYRAVPVIERLPASTLIGPAD